MPARYLGAPTAAWNLQNILPAQSSSEPVLWVDGGSGTARCGWGIPSAMDKLSSSTNQYSSHPSKCLITTQLAQQLPTCSGLRSLCHTCLAYSRDIPCCSLLWITFAKDPQRIKHGKVHCPHDGMLLKTMVKIQQAHWLKTIPIEISMSMTCTVSNNKP